MKRYEQTTFPHKLYDIERLVRDLITWQPSKKSRIIARYATRYKLMTGKDIKTDRAITET